MPTLTIQVEDKSVMAGLKKVLEAMKGVVIVPDHQKKTGIEEAMDDIRHDLCPQIVCPETEGEGICTLSMSRLIKNIN